MYVLFITHSHIQHITLPPTHTYCIWILKILGISISTHRNILLTHTLTFCKWMLQIKNLYMCVCDPFINMHAYIWAFVNIHTHVNMIHRRANMHTHTRAHTNRRMCAHINTNMHIWVLSIIYISMHIIILI